jgi:ABC-type iron transport system FetAB ATPase subunit
MSSLKISGLLPTPPRVGENEPPWIEPVTLDVAAGECVCITGPSGAGKSLLLRAIGDLDPSQGEVRLDGVERSAVAPPDWRRRVIYLAPESAWWDESVLAHFISARPVGLEAAGLSAAILTMPVSRLSTGERQRLALLRALDRRPEALLLDEPTASLDPDNSRRTEALLREYRLSRNAAVVWVSHDPAQVRRVADRHFRLEDGRLRARELARSKAAGA